MVLGLNSRSSSASTKLKNVALKNGVDISRFKSGVRDQDLRDKQFNCLTVLREVLDRKPGIRLWVCRCVCGKEIIARTGELNSGYRRHCGCKSHGTGAQSKRWTGYGELPGSYWSQVCRHARIRHLNVSATIKDAWNLFLAQDRKCALSGVRLFFRARGSTASLDRKNFRRGYTPDNIQWVHKDLNKMKWSMDND